MSWKSESQNSMPLFTTEAEYVIVSQVVKEIMSWTLNMRNRSKFILIIWERFFYLKTETHSKGLGTLTVDIILFGKWWKQAWSKVVLIKSEENVADLFKKSLNVKLLSVCLVFAIATSRKKERIAFHATSSIS